MLAISDSSIGQACWRSGELRIDNPFRRPRTQKQSSAKAEANQAKVPNFTVQSCLLLVKSFW